MNLVYQRTNSTTHHNVLNDEGEHFADAMYQTHAKGFYWQVVNNYNLQMRSGVVETEEQAKAAILEGAKWI